MSSTVTAGLTPQERERFKQACRRGYLVDISRQRCALANAWWHYCERADRPYVRVHSRAGSRSATLVVDLGTMGRRAVFFEAAEKKIEALYREHGVVGSAFFPGRHRVAFYRLPVETVQLLIPTICRLAFETELEEGRI